MNSLSNHGLVRRRRGPVFFDSTQRLLGLFGLAVWLVASTVVWGGVDHLDVAPQGQKETVAVLKIFEAKCASCHDPASKNRPAKKRWGDWRSLEKLKSGSILEAGHMPEEIDDIFLWLLLTDVPERRMPPQGSKTGPLSDVQRQAVRRWLEAGAPVPTEAFEPSGANTHSQEQGLDDLGFWRRLQRWLGRFHPAAVHLPIGLLLAAAVAEGLWMMTGQDWLAGAGRFGVLAAAFAGPVAAGLGWMAGSFESGVGWTLTLHRWLGVTVATVAVMTAVASERCRKDPSKARWPYRIMLFSNAVLVGGAGHLGGELVHGAGYYAW